MKLRTQDLGGAGSKESLDLPLDAPGWTGAGNRPGGGTCKGCGEPTCSRRMPATVTSKDES